MATKMPTIDPLGIIRKWIIVPDEDTIGEIIGYTESDDCYFIVYPVPIGSHFLGRSLHLSRDMIANMEGIHTGTREEMIEQKAVDDD